MTQICMEIWPKIITLPIGKLPSWIASEKVTNILVGFYSWDGKTPSRFQFVFCLFVFCSSDLIKPFRLHFIACMCYQWEVGGVIKDYSSNILVSSTIHTASRGCCYMTTISVYYSKVIFNQAYLFLFIWLNLFSFQWLNQAFQVTFYCMHVLSVGGGRSHYRLT